MLRLLGPPCGRKATLKVLIIGSSGFVGSHLIRHLVSQGHEVEGWSRSAQDPSNWRHRQVDLLAPQGLPVPDGSQWDAVFHLAGHTEPHLHWDQDRVFDNLRMTARVFDHLREASPGCRAILASSGHVYAPASTPVAEDSPLGPIHPYGLSKRLSEDWALARTSGLHVQVVRAFSQLGPGLPKSLMVPELLERIRRGENPIRMMGRNDRRDYLDIRDAVRAYEALLTVETPSGSVWNLCSGRETCVSALVGAILDSLELVRDIRFEHPEVTSFLGNRHRLSEATGWAPIHSLESTAHSLVRNRTSLGER